MSIVQPDLSSLGQIVNGHIGMFVWSSEPVENFARRFAKTDQFAFVIPPKSDDPNPSYYARTSSLRVPGDLSSRVGDAYIHDLTHPGNAVYVSYLDSLEPDPRIMKIIEQGPPRYFVTVEYSGLVKHKYSDAYLLTPQIEKDSVHLGRSVVNEDEFAVPFIMMPTNVFLN
ncbi:MAG: hypothetical protein ABIC95_02410 [archaeon]